MTHTCLLLKVDAVLSAGMRNEDLMQICQSLTDGCGPASFTLQCLKLGPTLDGLAESSHQEDSHPDAEIATSASGTESGPASSAEVIWAAEWSEPAVQGAIQVVELLPSLQALEMWGMAAFQTEIISLVRWVMFHANCQFAPWIVRSMTYHDPGYIGKHLKHLAMSAHIHVS